MQRSFFLPLSLLFFTLLAAQARGGDLHAGIEGRAPSIGLGAFAGGHSFADGTNLGVAPVSHAFRGARSHAASGLRASLGLGRRFQPEAEVVCNRAPGGAADAPQTSRGEAAVVAAPAAATSMPPSPLVQGAQVSPVASARLGESASSAGEAVAVALAADARTVSDLLERGREIKFAGANTKIAEVSMPFLDELAAALVKEPAVRLEIVSHTADSGDAKKDLALSKRRAEAVKYVLVGKGVSAVQLVATGRGSEDPIAPNITRSGRMRNERVELHRAGGH
jgi:outer membrane protein OmpA-like peptidoglycan-associated protein